MDRELENLSALVLRRISRVRGYNLRGSSNFKSTKAWIERRLTDKFLGLVIQELKFATGGSFIHEAFGQI